MHIIKNSCCFPSFKIDVLTGKVDDDPETIDQSSENTASAKRKSACKKKSNLNKYVICK
jgi:hypothetical protein